MRLPRVLVVVLMLIFDAVARAAHGDYWPAIQELRRAMTQSPDDPFLLRTAGQLAAWYDAQTDRSMLTPVDTQSLDWIRNSAQNKPAFADAYRASTQPVGPHAD